MIVCWINFLGYKSKLTFFVNLSSISSITENNKNIHLLGLNIDFIFSSS